MKKVLILSLICLFSLSICLIFNNRVTDAAIAQKINDKAYVTTEGEYTIYDLLNFYTVNKITDGQDVMYSMDGITYFASTEKKIDCRYVKSKIDCTIKAVKMTTIPIKDFSCDSKTYDGKGISNLIDGNDGSSGASCPYFQPTSVNSTVTIELDGYYNIQCLRWYAFEGFCPVGVIKYSLNGSSYKDMYEFDFTNSVVDDPKIVSYSGIPGDYEYKANNGITPLFYEHLITKQVNVKAKYLKIVVTGSLNMNVATREFSVFGEEYSPSNSDPEGISIAEKNGEGAYNTLATACMPGDTFNLTAVLENDLSLAKIDWISSDEYMVNVDDTGHVKVIRGGKSDYYTLTAKVQWDNTVYQDSIKIYIKHIANIVGLADMSYWGALNYYSLPGNMFDGVDGVWGNWCQPVDGTESYTVKLDFKQSIKFGDMVISIGNNIPEKITVYGYDSGYNKTTVQTFNSLIMNTKFTINSLGYYNCFEIKVEDFSFPSTIFEISIYNSEDFDLSTITTSEISDNRGPTSLGSYTPIKNSQESNNLEYINDTNIEKGQMIFIYNTKNKWIVLSIILVVVACSCVAFVAIYMVRKFKRK